MWIVVEYMSVSDASYSIVCCSLRLFCGVNMAMLWGTAVLGPLRLQHMIHFDAPLSDKTGLNSYSYQWILILNIKSDYLNKFMT
jgi:hypothetical protein